MPSVERGQQMKTEPRGHLHLGVWAEEEESSKETKEQPRQGTFQGEKEPLRPVLQRESNSMKR